MLSFFTTNVASPFSGIVIVEPDGSVVAAIARSITSFAASVTITELLQSATNVPPVVVSRAVFSTVDESIGVVLFLAVTLNVNSVVEFT